MSEDESINSDEIPSDQSSDSEIEDEEKENKALSNLKNSLNLENNVNQIPEKQENKINQNKIYYLENTSLNENEKNVQTTKSQKINFSDVFKTFQGNIKNETSRANLSRAVKNFGVSEKDKENENEKNEENNKKNNKSKKKEEVNRIVNNYKEEKEEKKLEREASYIAVGNEITGYQGKVKTLREADVVDFTQNDPKKVRSIGQKSLKEIASKKEKKEKGEDMHSKIDKILVRNNCATDDNILEQEKKELKNINPVELKRRHDELKQIRVRLLQKEIENKRKGKIKSKLYHKIKKNKKIKEENDLLEQLGQIDPEAVQQYIEKKKVDRVQERMQLKHSLNSKFQKTIKRYHFDRDQQVKEAIKDNFQLRDKLLQKIQGKENNDEYEENEDDEDNYEEEDENENDEKSKEGIYEKNGEKKIIMNFDENKDKDNKMKKKEEEINDKTGVFSMPFMKNAEDNLDIQNKIEKLKNKLNNIEDFDDYDKIEKDVNIESDSDKDISDNDKKNNKLKNKNKNTQKAPVITKDTLKKINEDTKKINESNEKNKKIDIKFDADTLQQMISEENINEDINTFNNFLIENDINKKEFLENENKEQLEEIKKNNPEFVPGWGSWAGDVNEIKVKEFLKKKRYEEKIKRLKEQANEGRDNKFVKISNQIDRNFSQFLVQELPNDMTNTEQFEKYNKTLIGREVNSLNLYKKLIQPKIVKKLGQIINPMTANDSTKGMQIQEIIEKVTKKKKFTKAKL